MFINFIHSVVHLLLFLSVVLLLAVNGCLMMSIIVLDMPFYHFSSIRFHFMYFVQNIHVVWWVHNYIFMSFCHDVMLLFVIIFLALMSTLSDINIYCITNNLKLMLASQCLFLIFLTLNLIMFL